MRPALTRYRPGEQGEPTGKSASPGRGKNGAAPGHSATIFDEFSGSSISRIVQLVKLAYTQGMAVGPRKIRRISSSEARANLAVLLEAVGDRRERVLIERRGKTPVALVSVDDLLRYQMLEALQSRSSESH